MKLLNITNDNKIINNKFSYKGELIDIINVRRREIKKIWSPRIIFGRIDTELLMDKLPHLSNIASQVCDAQYLGVLAGVCDGGFRDICKYHESFAYKCCEIISGNCKRGRLQAFVGIRHVADIYILHEAPLRADLLVL